MQQGGQKKSKVAVNSFPNYHIPLLAWFEIDGSGLTDHECLRTGTLHEICEILTLINQNKSEASS